MCFPHIHVKEIWAERKITSFSTPADMIHISLITLIFNPTLMMTKYYIGYDTKNFHCIIYGEHFLSNYHLCWLNIASILSHWILLLQSLFYDWLAKCVSKDESFLHEKFRKVRSPLSVWVFGSSQNQWLVERTWLSRKEQECLQGRCQN